MRGLLTSLKPFNTACFCGDGAKLKRSTEACAAGWWIKGGSPIAAAKVNAVNDATGFARSQETQEDGYYSIANLPLGTYTVSIQKSGFTSERHTGVVLDAGSTASIDAQLKVGEVATTVEVTGGAPVIEPDTVSTGPDHRAH